jgi:hypothetical protein
VTLRFRKDSIRQLLIIGARQIVFTGLSVLLQSCVSSYHITPALDPRLGYSGGTQVRFQVPAGWQKGNQIEPTDAHAFTWHGETGKEIVILSVEAFHLDRYQPLTQSEQAYSYLEGIHDHDDPSVTMHEIGSFNGGVNGMLTVYHYSSDYFQNRLIAYLIKGQTMVEERLLGRDAKKTLSQLYALQGTARSVDIVNQL